MLPPSKKITTKQNKKSVLNLITTCFFLKDDFFKKENLITFNFSQFKRVVFSFCFLLKVFLSLFEIYEKNY